MLGSFGLMFNVYFSFLDLYSIKINKIKNQNQNHEKERKKERGEMRERDNSKIFNHQPTLVRE